MSAADEIRSLPAPAIRGPRTLDHAYAACAAITRERAANFYYGIRLLPPDKRRALCAVYAFARRVDDIGDGRSPPAVKLAQLRSARDEVARMHHRAEGAHGSSVVLALADAATRFPLPVPSIVDLIDGVESDVRGTAYRCVDDLITYCRRVAGSIGRLSVSIFGATEPERAAGLADDLGVAMQLTNILRDVAEDHALGRVYLPVEDLQRFGLTADDLTRSSPRTTDVVRFEVARAQEWFGRGLPLLGLLDRRSASCVGAMAGIYRRILGRIEADPTVVFAGRISLQPWEKGWVAARSLVGVHP
jgi:phytoene synthase